MSESCFSAQRYHKHLLKLSDEKKKKKTLCKPHQKAWQRKSSSNAQMVIMFLSFAESCDPLNSFNWWGGGRSYNSTLNVCQADFYRSRIMCSEKNTRRIMRFCFVFFLFQYCHFGRLLPVAHVFMVGWFCLTFSPLFNGLRDSWSKNCSEIAKVSTQGLNYTKHISSFNLRITGFNTFLLFCCFFFFFFFIPPNVSYIFLDYALNHGSDLKLIRDFTIISKSRHRLHCDVSDCESFQFSTLVTY